MQGQLVLTAGDCTGKVLGFNKPTDSRARYGLQFLGVRIDVAGLVLVYNVVGYKNAIAMLVDTEQYWIGRELPCMISHVERDGAIYPEISVKI